MNRSRAKWRLIAAGLALALGVEIYLLVYDIPILRDPDMNRVVSGARGAIVAELVDRKNVVRIQEAGDIVWEDISPGQKLHQSQSVLTLEGAQAQIAFLDGSGLVVDESSLVRIERLEKSGRIVVSLMRGTLHKRGRHRTGKPSDRDMEIRLGSATAIAKAGSEVTVVASPETAMGHRILVQEGQIALDAGTGSIEVSKGEEAQFTPDASSPPRTRKLPFTLVYPRSNEIVSRNGKTAFKWEVDTAIAKGGPLELLVSADPGFGEGTLKSTIGATHPPLKTIQAAIDMSGFADAEKLFWKVRSVSQGLESAIETFVLEERIRPSLVHPLHHARITPGTATTLVWRPVPEAAGYEIEINSKTVSSKDSYYEHHEWSEGENTWRVRAKTDEGRFTDWSETRMIEVVGHDQPPPPPTELHDAEIKDPPSAPDPGRNPAQEHSWLRFFVSSAWAADEPAPPTRYDVHLSWDPVKAAAGYRVQISRTSDFKTIIAESETTVPSWDWKYTPGMENSKGRVFYRVASIGKNGKAGSFSRPKPVLIPEKYRLAKAPSTEKYKADEADEPRQADIQEKAAASVVNPAPPEPQATTASSPGGQTKAETTPPPGRRWSLSASGGLGFASSSQSSGEADLSSVTLEGPHPLQRLSIRALLTDEEQASAWVADLGASLATYSKADGQSSPQGDVHVAQLRLDAFRQVDFSREFSWGIGGTLQSRTRWVKTSGQTVDARGALSLGPSAFVVRESKGALREAGFRLGIPLTGAMTGGPAGVDASIWGELTLFKFNRGQIGIHLESEANWMRWKTPASTSLTAWSAWVAPFFHFSSSAR